ncbi:hypothetical protein I314_01693 [Cryptococcus bacillisporus CA1873]|uniref:Uncharacterized protein n=1 Tax=Cryptococcus bacillisporus CA1873 TaxID=1296111 RepID=A0ABR5BGA5_CRYGA|nr:hypothetical protein I314_01693 [Cryptococcus bacillisporus CA1873]|eukprot:KIR68199.1 hypothetical protein I314_01693 [Cryptococcus gattii CA1873]
MDNISGSSDTSLPSGLVLPDPSSNAAGASVWDQTITLNAGAKGTGGSDNIITTSTIVKVSSAAAPASSTIPMTPAAATTSADLVTSAQPVTSPVHMTSAAADELATSAESLASFSATDENDYSFDNGDYDSTSVIAVQTNSNLKASSSVVPSDNQHVTSFDASTYPPSTTSLLSSVYHTDDTYEGSSDGNLSDSERRTPIPFPSDRSNGGITITALDAGPSSTTQESSSQSDASEAGSLSSSVSSYESQISPTRNDDNDSPSETDQSQSQYFEPRLPRLRTLRAPTVSALVEANDGSSVTLANGSVSADDFDSYTSASASTRADEAKVTGGSEGDVSTGAAVADVASTEGGNGMNLKGGLAAFVSETQASRGIAKGKHKNYNKESGVGENTASVTTDNTITAPTESTSLRTLSDSLMAEPTIMSP